MVREFRFRKLDEALRSSVRDRAQAQQTVTHGPRNVAAASLCQCADRHSSDERLGMVVHFRLRVNRSALGQSDDPEVPGPSPIVIICPLIFPLWC
jgi:hypothetical protein